MPADVIWDRYAREFLRKLPDKISRRIYKKVNDEIMLDVERHLETLTGIGGYKIRIGDYRLFVDYSRNENTPIIRSIRHRRDAYKKR